MSFTLLQFTDCHLRDKKGERLLGVDTEETFDKVFQQALTEHTQIDLIVFTGDISNDPSPRPYQSIIDKLPEGVAHVWLPGNHDENALMQQIVGDSFLPDVDLGNWHITLLDSSVVNKISGYISNQEMARLASVIEQSPDKHHAVFMHHHLLPMNSSWLDQHMIENSSDALSFLEQFEAIKLIVNGHVHQNSRNTHKHLPIFSTPSTCFQFLPSSEAFALDTQMPGYRAFKLLDDGRFETRVYRLPKENLSIDRQATGY